MTADRAHSETVPDPVRQGARTARAAPALIGPTGASLSYGALDAAIDRMAARLQGAGITAGDHVACLLPRRPAYVALLLALGRQGAVAAPLPARIPAAGWPPLLEAIGARAFIVEEAGKAPPHVDVIASTRLTDDAAPDGLLREPPPAGSAREGSGEWPTDRPLTLVFTSGSTGIPKAALHTAGNHYFSADGSQQNLALAPGDRWLLSLPLYHVGGLAVALRCLWAGATVVFSKPDESLGEALRRTRATHVSLVAAQLRRLLEAMPAAGAAQQGPAAYGEAPWASLKAVLLGGGPAPPALVGEARQAGLPLLVSYGLTEMASQVTTTALGDSLAVLQRTAGRPLRHRRVRIRAERAGAEGEILVKGRTRFAGYLKGGRLQRPFTEAFGEDGWFATGDRGRFDAAGRLRVTGRLGRRFTSGGENVQPEEIEAALRRLPRVADAAVVPVPHETFGQRPIAFIRGTSQEPFRPEAEASLLRAALQATLPKFKIPEAFYPWPAEAEGDMKPDRAFLRQKARRLAEGGE